MIIWNISVLLDEVSCNSLGVVHGMQVLGKVLHIKNMQLIISLLSVFLGYSGWNYIIVYSKLIFCCICSCFTI